MKVTKPPRSPRVCGLPMSWSRAPKRSAVRRVISSASGSSSSARVSSARSPAKRSRSASTSSARSRTAIVWPWTSRWWFGSLFDPAQRRELGQDDRGQAELVEQPEPGAAGRAPPISWRSSTSWRSPAGSAARAACGTGQRLGPGVDRQPELGGEPRRPQQPQRVGGEALARRPPAGRRARGRRGRPCGSTGSPPASGTATAPTVKSRAPRSASIVSPRRALTSTCQAASRPTARQVSNSEESSKAWPSPAAAIDRATGRRVARDREVEVDHLAPAGRVADRAADDPGAAPSEPESARRESSTTGAAASRSSRLNVSPPPAARGRISRM